jgi:cytochrome c oxidase subunit I
MTTDHKAVGLRYLITTFAFFLAGGVLALIIRLQLAAPGGQIATGDVYNQVLTLHGTTMIFFFIIPAFLGLASYLVPLMIGARDMAFPRANAAAYWLLLAGGLALYASVLFGGAPAAGWTAYVPLSTARFSVTHGIDFWIAALLLASVSAMLSAANILVTVARGRAPGVTLLRLPLFVVAMIATALMILLATPSLLAGLSALLADRVLGTSFFNTGRGADPLVWQHLFWFYAHPAVYIMILPAMGVLSEVFPTFARRPLASALAVSGATLAITLLGFVVWAHHMFSTGADTRVDIFFMTASLAIAVPTGVEVFAWITTLWNGSLLFRSPLNFALGSLSLFVLGGITGVMLALVPIDWQVTDTYFVVNHIHYVLVGGSLFGLFAALFYWLPRISGRLLDERLARWQFWLMLPGVHLTFLPMLALGVLGMPRRIYTYPAGAGWDAWNLTATLGAFLIALGVLLFLANVWNSLVRGRGAPAGSNPWDGTTLEWSADSAEC